MKKILTILILSVIVNITFSQTRNCGTMEHLDYLKSQDPQLNQKIQQNENILQSWIQNQTEIATGLILSGCSKSSPKPTCQEGGELQITQEENN